MIDTWLQGIEFIPVKPSILDAYKAQMKAPEVYDRLHPPRVGARNAWTDWHQEQAEHLRSQMIVVNGIEVHKYQLDEIAKRIGSTSPTVSKHLKEGK